MKKQKLEEEKEIMNDKDLTFGQKQKKLRDLRKKMKKRSFMEMKSTDIQSTHAPPNNQNNTPNSSNAPNEPMRKKNYNRADTPYEIVTRSCKLGVVRPQWIIRHGSVKINASAFKHLNNFIRKCHNEKTICKRCHKSGHFTVDLYKPNGTYKPRLVVYCNGQWNEDEQHMSEGCNGILINIFIDNKSQV